MSNSNYKPLMKLYKYNNQLLSKLKNKNTHAQKKQKTKRQTTFKHSFICFSYCTMYCTDLNMNDSVR